MEKIGKILRLFFLALIFLGLSAGYKIFGPKDAPDDQTDDGLFNFQNKAHADTPPPPESCASCIESCDDSCSDSGDSCGDS